MSVKALLWAWELPDIPPLEHMVLSVLADRAGDLPGDEPMAEGLLDREALARGARLSRSRSDQALGYLIGLGLVEVGPTEGGVRRETYRLNLAAGGVS